MVSLVSSIIFSTLSPTSGLLWSEFQRICPVGSISFNLRKIWFYNFMVMLLTRQINHNLYVTCLWRWRRTPDSPFHLVVICVTRTDGQQSLLIVPWCKILKRSKYKVFEMQCHKKKHNSSKLYSETPWAINTSNIVYFSILM